MNWTNLQFAACLRAGKNRASFSSIPSLRPNRWPPAWRARLPLTVVLLLTLAPSVLPQSHDEYAVKAAFVYNLTKFVEWPETNNRISIAVVGDGPMAELLKTSLEGKISESRPIHVLLSPSSDELEHCNMIYLANLAPTRVRATLDQLRGKNILTVSDSDSFVRQGGMIGLVTMGDHVQIQIGLETARQSRLKISSRLLSIATLVPPASEVKH